MIPEFNEDGNLPPGIHHAGWDEIAARFGSTPYRRELLQGLRAALAMLARAGCREAYLDGSFVTAAVAPGDYDACWDTQGVNPALLDPVMLNFANGRAAQKLKYRGEFFAASTRELNTGSLFLEFFQVDKNTGKSKGIVAIDLRGLHL